MESIIDKLRKYEDYVAIGGASEKQIANAEHILNLTFNDEYREYLTEFGTASVNGHELTGICQSKRLNIIDATIEAKKINPNVPDGFYLIENLGIDHIMIWQNKNGELFQTVGNNTPEKIALTLMDYISQ